jgi:hypothetical protein
MRLFSFILTTAWATLALGEVVIDALNVTDLRNGVLRNTSALSPLDSSTAGTEPTVRIAADYDPNAYADAAM